MNEVGYNPGGIKLRVGDPWAGWFIHEGQHQTAVPVPVTLTVVRVNQVSLMLYFFSTQETFASCDQTDPVHSDFLVSEEEELSPGRSSSSSRGTHWMVQSQSDLNEESIQTDWTGRPGLRLGVPLERPALGGSNPPISHWELDDITKKKAQLVWAAAARCNRLAAAEPAWLLTDLWLLTWMWEKKDPTVSHWLSPAAEPGTVCFKTPDSTKEYNNAGCYLLLQRGTMARCCLNAVE